MIVHSVLAPVCHQVVLAQVELTQDAKVRFCGINGVGGIFTTSKCAKKIMFVFTQDEFQSF